MVNGVSVQIGCKMGIKAYYFILLKVERMKKGISPANYSFNSHLKQLKMTLLRIKYFSSHHIVNSVSMFYLCPPLLGN